MHIAQALAKPHQFAASIPNALLKERLKQRDLLASKEDRVAGIVLQWAVVRLLDELLQDLRRQERQPLDDEGQWRIVKLGALEEDLGWERIDQEAHNARAIRRPYLPLVHVGDMCTLGNPFRIADCLINI
jgi:hypothetical protein